jgi:hypothetical protein
MKKILNLVFAFVMVLSIVFIGDIVSSNNPYAAQAQTQVTVKHKKRVGVTRKVYRKGKWVAVKTWHGTKYVGRKTWHGTKYVGRKTWHGTKWTTHKVKTGTKKIFHKTKKAVY